MEEYKELRHEGAIRIIRTVDDGGTRYMEMRYPVAYLATADGHVIDWHTGVTVLRSAIGPSPKPRRHWWQLWREKA